MTKLLVNNANIVMMFNIKMLSFAKFFCLVFCVVLWMCDKGCKRYESIFYYCQGARHSKYWEQLLYSRAPQTFSIATPLISLNFQQQPFTVNMIKSAKYVFVVGTPLSDLWSSLLIYLVLDDPFLASLVVGHLVPEKCIRLQTN